MKCNFPMNTHVRLLEDTFMLLSFPETLTWVGWWKNDVQVLTRVAAGLQEQDLHIKGTLLKEKDLHNKGTLLFSNGTFNLS